MNSNLKSLLILSIFCLLVYGMYAVFTKYDVFNSAQVHAEDIEKQTLELEKTVFAQLNEISSIRFDESIFTREDYQSLIDLSVELPQPKLSRPNPFAELP